jgi:hypothetical protein
MSLIENADTATIQTILSTIKSQAGGANNLQESTQRAMECFHAQFAESVVLARTYATVPYKMLPATDRSFVQAVAQDKGQLSILTEETQALSLLGTAGIDPAWCDRYSSKGHLGIPLLSEDFVAGIPMIAGLIHQLGMSVDLYKRLSPSQSAEKFGVFAESFFVSDAAASRDSIGRLIIPAQDFVQQYEVHTVFGVGGQFAATGMILICIVFTRETLSQTPAWLLRLPLLLGTAPFRSFLPERFTAAIKMRREFFKELLMLSLTTFRNDKIISKDFSI